MPWRWPARPQRVSQPNTGRQQSPRHAAEYEPPPGEPELAPLEISHAQMKDAVCVGTAVTLGQGFPWVARYLDAWWVEYEGGWLRVTDDHVTTELDAVAARLADAAVADLGNSPVSRAGIQDADASTRP